MERIEVLGVPVDIVKIEELEGEVLKILEKKGTKQIVFLTVWDKGEHEEKVRVQGLPECG